MREILWGDNFITHRAFCDALAKENYKVQQGIGSIEGPLQAPPQKLFQSSLPASLSSSNLSTVMNLAISNQDISPHPTFAFTNSSGVMFSHGSDQLLDHHTSLAPNLQHNGNNSTCLSSGSGTKIPHLEMASAYMSATTLLQKAVEMGAMVSDSSISPVLLNGFAGYSASGRSCGEPSHDPLNIFP